MKFKECQTNPNDQIIQMTKMCIGNLVNKLSKLSKFKYCFKNPNNELLIWCKCV